jgi:hypothetical protein
MPYHFRITVLHFHHCYRVCVEIGNVWGSGYVEIRNTEGTNVKLRERRLIDKVDECGSDDEDEDEDEENDAEYAATYATAITFSGF